LTQLIQQLPHGWTEVSIGDLMVKRATLDPLQTPDAAYELWSVPSFPTGSPERAVGRDIGSSKQRVEPGDVLLCKINPRINRVWIVVGDQGLPQIASTEWVVLRREGIDPAFLAYQLRETHFREALCADVSGVGGSLIRARPQAIAKMRIAIAPLSEQRRIVAKLDELLARSYAARESLEAIPDLLMQHRAAVLHAVVRDLDAEPRLMLEALIADDRKITYGVVQTGAPTPGGVQTVRCGDIKGFAVAEDSLKLVSREVEAQYPRTRLRGGEVLIAIRGSVGETAVASPRLYGANISREVAVIPVGEVVLPEYVMYLLASPAISAAISGKVKGVAQSGINIADLRRIEVPVPSLERQAEIVSRIERALAKIESAHLSAAEARTGLDNLDNAVLSMAFRGELVPQDRNDERASALVERIRAGVATAESEQPSSARRHRSQGRLRAAGR
jgi:type I restriction enzyme, S subunit